MGGGQSSTTSEQIPSWVSDAGKQVYGQAQNFYSSQTANPPPSVQVAPFSSLQNDVFSQLANYKPVDTSGQAISLIDQGTQPITTDNVMDQTGALGTIASWMNPFTGAAVQPAIDAITKQGNAQAQQIGGQAQSAHAFGDARQGVLEGENNFQTESAIGNTTSQAYAGAYNSAMAEREQAIQDQISTATGNRAADIAGAGALTTTSSASQNNFLALMQSLLGAGSSQQQQSQSQLDVPLQNWQNQSQNAYDSLSALVSTLGQLPYPRSSTTTTNDGGAGAAGGIGSLLGGLGSLLGVL